MKDEALLLDGLDVAYHVRGRDMPVLRGVSFRVHRGETYGLVGESGCGKSTAALAALGGLPANGRVRAGQVRVAGEDLGRLNAEALRRLRARTVSMVFQDPGRALNPALTVGRQVAESFELLGHARAEATAQAEAALARVQISGPARVMASYPHQLSGGMQQRAVIAMALAKDPALLVLDEPTTGLDATVEAEVLDLVARLRDELASGVLLISHNLAVVERVAGRVAVMYLGRIVETAATAALFATPRHPYTRALLASVLTPEPGLGLPLVPIGDTLPDPAHVPGGCRFHPRCPEAEPRCSVQSPEGLRVGGRLVECLVEAG